MARGREKLRRIRWLVDIAIFLDKLVPAFISKTIFLCMKYIPGNLCLFFRYVLLHKILKSCGENVALHDGVHLFYPEKISIGDNVSIHPMCYIDGAGKIDIGNDVSIAHGVTIMSSSHQYSSLDLSIKDQGVSMDEVTIKNNVWIGAKATILGGVVIGEGTIIAAGAVVTKDIEKNCIVAGVPARVIKKRGE